jgi:hypothetical protein
LLPRAPSPQARGSTHNHARLPVAHLELAFSNFVTHTRARDRPGRATRRLQTDPPELGGPLQQQPDRRRTETPRLNLFI